MERMPQFYSRMSDICVVREHPKTRGAPWRSVGTSCQPPWKVRCHRLARQVYSRVGEIGRAGTFVCHYSSDVTVSKQVPLVIPRRRARARARSTLRDRRCRRAQPHRCAHRQRRPRCRSGHCRSDRCRRSRSSLKTDDGNAHGRRAHHGGPRARRHRDRDAARV